MCKKLRTSIPCVILMLALTAAATADPLQQDPGPDGIVSVEAEHFDANVKGPDGDEWILVGPTGGFTGTAGMQAPNGNGGHDTDYVANSERLDYEINFVKTGTHFVWVLAWGEGGSDDSCHIGLDGQATPLSDRMTGWSASYSWRNGRYQRPELSQIDITSTGPHTLNLWVREDGLIVDKIVLTTNPNFTLSGSEPGPPESNRGLVLNAFNPTPEDGALHQDVWVSLSWSPGQTATSHDVYMGESFADVNDGAAGTFRGNQPSTSFFVGLGLPGDPYPSGLVPGTTYYWRIDEVEADGTTKHRGGVWSFSIPPRTAYDPAPATGSKFVDPDVKLSWAPGLSAKLHTVFFGTSFEDVNSATVGTPTTVTTFTPSGPLEGDKTYYWRVDEFDGSATHKGNIWSFTTVPNIPITDPNLVGWWKFESGSGTRVIDFSGHGNHGTIVPGVLDTVHWVEGVFNKALQFLGDNMGHVELPPNMVTTAKGSVLMWINTTQGNAANNNEGMLWYGTETGGDGYGDENEIHLNIDDPGEGQLDFVLQGTADVTLEYDNIGGTGWRHVAATWDLTDGCRLYVDGQEVDVEAHNNTAVNLAVIRLGRPVGTGNGNRYYEGLMDDVRLFDRAISAAQISEIMTKGEDPLRAGAINPRNGALISINLATPLRWAPGEKAAQHDVYFGLDKDAVTNADATDTTGLYRGRQSTTSYTPPEGVQLNGGPYYWRIDEVNTDGTLTMGGVWSFSVADYVLVEDFESYNDIPAGQPGSNLVYVAWLDGYGTTTNGSTIGYPVGASMETANVHSGTQSAPLLYNNSTAAFSEAERTFAAQDWTEHGIQTLSLWFFGDAANLPGQLYVKINGVKVPYDGDATNLKKPLWQVWNINLASVGVNLRSVTRLAIGVDTKGATGTLLLDDIRLYPYARELITPVQPDPAGLVARFAFEGNANDSAGGHNGAPNGSPLYVAGRSGQAVSLDGVDDYLFIGGVGISGAAPRTIAGWAKATVLGTPAWVNVFGFTGPAGNDGHFDIELVGDTANTTLGWYGLHVYGWEQDIMAIDLEWHHLAASYDGTTIKWYGDGALVGSDNTRILNTPDNVHIGKREDNTNYFPGSVDEVQIFNRTLSDAEVAGLAGRTTPFDKPF